MNKTVDLTVWLFKLLMSQRLSAQLWAQVGVGRNNFISAQPHPEQVTGGIAVIAVVV